MMLGSAIEFTHSLILLLLLLLAMVYYYYYYSQECSRVQFQHFLVDSPLSSEDDNDNDSLSFLCSTAGHTNDIDISLYIPCGSYHQHYRIDGQLVAVGIIDILPSCLTSVYCFYDTAFSDLSLGKVVAMAEINWVQRCQNIRPKIQYYCLGYYVHSCPKMSYKVTS